STKNTTHFFLRYFIKIKVIYKKDYTSATRTYCKHSVAGEALKASTGGVNCRPSASMAGSAKQVRF
ncbi:hypothetical protein ACOQWH_002474, partial [Cronobacter turicensis]